MDGTSQDMDTLVERMNHLRDEGFKNEFKLEAKKLTCDQCNYYSPDQVKIVQFYRFEGDSDPGDMQVLYAIETKDGTKGFLTDGFGTYASPGITEFISRIPELHKKGVY